MIAPFYGEFLMSPIPLEMALNYCSHGCEFCFANLSDPTRVANPKAIMGLLSAYRDRNTLEAMLLRDGYPITVSNRVDPFAHSNSAVALAVLETMAELGIPACIQTRGGKGVEHAVRFLPPSVWYISVNTADDDLRRRLEPGAPTIQSRFDLMHLLREKGHRVVLGLNPCLPEWCPEPEAVLEPARDAGVEGVWLGALHFNRDQLANMRHRGREAIGEAIIARSLKRCAADEDLAHVLRSAAVATDLGMSAFFAGQYTRSDFFAPYHETYSATFPTQQDFINVCHDAGADLVAFEDWVRFMAPRLPAGEDLPIDGYVASVARNIAREPLTGRLREWFGSEKLPPRLSYVDVLAVMWAEPRHRGNLARSPAFAYAGVAKDDGWMEVVDSDIGWPMMVFHPTGHPWTCGQIREKGDRKQGWWTMVELETA